MPVSEKRGNVCTLVTVRQIRESCVLGDSNALPAADCRSAVVRDGVARIMAFLFRNV